MSMINTINNFLLYFCMVLYNLPLKLINNPNYFFNNFYCNLKDTANKFSKQKLLFKVLFFSSLYPIILNLNYTISIM